MSGLVAEYVPAAPGLGLTGTARVERLPFSDARSFVPELPDGTAAFDVAVRSERRHVRDHDFGPVGGPGESRATGRSPCLSAHLRASASWPRIFIRSSASRLWSGSSARFRTAASCVDGSRARPRHSPSTFKPGCRRGGPGAVPGACLRLAHSGSEGIYALRGADIELEDVPWRRPSRGRSPALARDARLSGRILLRGPPGDAPLTLDISLALGVGTLFLGGTLDLRGPVVAYDLEGRVVGLELDTLVEPEVPPVALTARFDLSGRGTDPATADARLQLRGYFTGWREGPADTVAVSAAVRGGTLDGDRGAPLRDAVPERGRTWRFIEPPAGGIEYSVTIASLEPFGPYLPGLDPRQIARGGVRSEGALTGTSSEPRLAGRLEGADVEYGKWAAESVVGEYDVAFGAGLPATRIEVAATGLRTPGNEVYDSARASFVLEERRFALNAVAERADGGILELSGDGQVAANGAVDAVVRRLNVDLDGERWSLTRPAQVAWAPDTGLEIHGFELREEGGDGRITADGRLPPADAASIRVEVAAFPSAGPRAPGREPVVTGELWASAQASPAEAPLIQAEFRLEQDGFGTRMRRG